MIDRAFVPSQITARIAALRKLREIASLCGCDRCWQLILAADVRITELERFQLSMNGAVKI